MKRYRDIAGDGGSDVVAQVGAQRRAIADALAGVRHLLAVGSGKGGVGKSTVTMALAQALRSEGRAVAILDADVNGPSQARLAGLEGIPWLPGDSGLRLPRRRDGLGVVSFGSVLPEEMPAELGSAGEDDDHAWRASRELTTLGQLLAAIEWGELDVLLVDLPPGTERTLHFAHFLGERAAFLLVTVPSQLSRGVVARSVTALGKTRARLLGYVENMAGYLCRDCGEVKPLFPEKATELPLPRLGAIPFDPILAELCDQGWPEATNGLPALAAARELAANLLTELENER